MEHIDICIVGAGVVGLSVAASLAGERKNILVLEKNMGLGRETSSRNSEIIHAGIYYPTNSLKAKLCVEGRDEIYRLAESRPIARRLGKLIVALNEREVPILETLCTQGKRNGVEDLELLPGADVRKKEPNIHAFAALYSPSTGIVDSHALMEYFYRKALDGGIDFAFSYALEAVERGGDGYKIFARNSDGDEFSFISRVVVNCAGLQSDRVASLAGVDIEREDLRLKLCKGVYYNVPHSKSGMVSRLIYPCPGLEHLGIHTVGDMQGAMKLGPNAFYIDEIDYSVDDSFADDFYCAVREFLPFIEREDLEPAMAGIRPKLQGPGEPFRDFVIRDEASNGLPGFINLIGIESPGLTAAPAIGRLVKDIIE